RISERRKQRRHILACLEALDAERALAGCRQAVVGVEPRTDAVRQPEPDQAGHGKDDGVVLAAVELRKACLHVAAQQPCLELRMALENLSGSAQTGGSDDCPCRKIFYLFKIVRDKGIPGIFPFED